VSPSTRSYSLLAAVRHDSSSCARGHVAAFLSSSVNNSYTDFTR